MANRLDSALVVSGSVTATELKITGATPIDSSDLEHRFQHSWSQESGTTATAQTFVVHTICGTSGSILAFEAGSVVVCVGDATITVDLTKNGVSVLAAAITLDNANTVRVTESATISTATLADGDVLEVAVTVNAGTGTLGKGVFATVALKEDPV